MEKLKYSFPTSCKQNYPQFHEIASYAHYHECRRLRNSSYSYIFRTFVFLGDPANNKKIFAIINKILLFVPSLFSFLLPALITFFSFPEQERPGGCRILPARPNKFIFWGFLPQGGRRMWFFRYRKNKV